MQLKKAHSEEQAGKGKTNPERCPVSSTQTECKMSFNTRTKTTLHRDTQLKSCATGYL